MRLRRPEPHTLAGAYALDAVAGADRARFDRHLARCQACARELRELREAAARLADAVAAEPPPVVIERALAAAARTRQLPPATGPARAVRSRNAAPLGGRALLPRLALGLAALFLAAATAAAAAVLTVEHRLGVDQRRDQAIAQVLNAPDAVRLTARVSAGGTVTVVVSRRDRSLVFTTAGLAPLTGARCYQLWLMGPSGDRSAGMLPEPLQGMTAPVTTSGLAAGDWVGLTVEPAGGSSRPTSQPILMLSLPT